jgi:mannose-6-phosphate isomerase-like protein (cupin superfamily)
MRRQFHFRIGKRMTRRSTQATLENHYAWGEVCDGWHLVWSDDLSVIEERMPPGSAEQRHFHVRARQFFYVLYGELTMEIDGRLQLIGPRQGIEVLPGEAHQASNRSDAAVRFLVISQPPGRGDRQPA